MDYETQNELKEVMTAASVDLLEIKAIIDALSDINQADTTTCVILNIIRDMVKNVFNKNCKCKSLLDLV